MVDTEAEACSKDLSNHLVKGVASLKENDGENRGKGWRMNDWLIDWLIGGRDFMDVFVVVVVVGCENPAVQLESVWTSSLKKFKIDSFTLGFRSPVLQKWKNETLVV